MHVREWGSPGGRPLVFWHALGAAQSGAYIAEIAPSLTDVGYRVLGVDAPGFGDSPALPPERYEPDSLVALLGDVLDERGIERAVLMGHSWGGSISMAFAAQAPERVEGLVLVDSAQMDYQDSPNFPHGKSLEDLIADAAEETAGLRDRLALPEVRGAVLYGITKMRVTEFWPPVAEAGIPILLLLATEPEDTRGQNEKWAPIFAERFPDAEIRFVEGAGHDLIADAGAEVARLIRDWAIAART